MSLRVVLMLALVAMVSFVPAGFAAERELPAPMGEAETVFAVEGDGEFLEVVLGPILRRDKPIGMTSHRIADVRPYIGHVVRRQYAVRGSDSTGELHSHFTQWLGTAGFEVLLDAKGDSPMAPGGTSWALRAYGDLPTEVVTELSGTYDKSRRRYLVAERREEGELAVLALLINPRRTGDIRVQLDAVFVDSTLSAPFAITASELGPRVKMGGRVPLSGVRYLGRKQVPRDSSAVVLAQVAAMLRLDPEISISVVGYADATGQPEAAQQLALLRAEAVVDLLVDEHDAPANRLEARLAAIEPPDAASTGSVASDSTAMPADEDRAAMAPGAAVSVIALELRDPH